MYFSAKQMHGQSSEPMFPEERHGAFESNNRLFTSEQVPHVGQREHLKKRPESNLEINNISFDQTEKKHKGNPEPDVRFLCLIRVLSSLES